MRGSGGARRRGGVRVAVAALAAVMAAVVAAGCTSPPESMFGEGKQVRVGTKGDQPGTSFTRHAGVYDGFDIAVAKEVLGGVGVAEPLFTGVLSKNRAIDLRKGAVDLVVGTYSITKKRMAPTTEPNGEGLDFVGPYASTPQGVLVRAEDRDRYHALDDLDGRLVCVWKGTTSVQELSRPAYRQIRLHEEEDAAYCVKALKEGRVDAVSTDQMILYGFMEAEPALTVVPGIAFGATNDYGIAMVKGHREDCERLRDALKTYVSGNDWDRDFQNNLDVMPAAERNEAKPTTSEIDAVSCRDHPANASID
ncbi:transporter substrate-binding domain-containing protein [Streptomyces sp. NPDC003027]